MRTRAIKRYIEEPAIFVRTLLGVQPDPWQEEVLKALAQNGRVAVRSGHGVGKTALESWAVLWFLFTRPFPKVVCTAPTSRQLYDILWAELSKWLKRSALLNELFEWHKTKIIFREEPERWFATARTAARPENMAGFHEKSILFVLDEASGIDDAIFEAIEGALTTSDAKLLICGNPTRNSGFFQRAFFEERELYSTFKVSSPESPRVSAEYGARLIRQYGKESDVVRVRVLGEFPKAQADGLISLEHVEAAMNREATLQGEVVIGVDVARYGDDETVLAGRVGCDCVRLLHWRKSDLMTTCGRVVGEVSRLLALFKKNHAVVNVDDSGMGGGVTDRLREVFAEKNMAVQVNACLNNARPHDKHFANWATESWFGLKERLAAGEITLPRDDILAGQLTTRRYRLTSADKLILEPKEEYKKRYKRSPDRADAVVLCYAPARIITTLPAFPTQKSYWRF